MAPEKKAGLKTKAGESEMSERKEKLNIELSTSVPALKMLMELNLELFDAVYLGNPGCLDYKDNLNVKKKDLKKAIKYLKDSGKKACLSTLIAPRNREFSGVADIIETALEYGIDLIEVHNMGLLYFIHEKYPGTKVVIGGFGNVYTDLTAEKLREYGAVRIVPNYELTFQEINYIKNHVPVEIELEIHGKIPLGISENCLLMEHEKELGKKCPELCLDTIWLKFKDWSIRNFGKLTYSGRDLSLIEYLDVLLDRGFSIFRIDALSETASYANDVAAVYREALVCAANEKYSVKKEWLERLEKTCANGFCNGYLFARSGSDYVPRGEGLEFIKRHRSLEGGK